MFSQNRANGSESSTELYFDYVRQVAAPYRRQAKECLVEFIRRRHRDVGEDCFVTFVENHGKLQEMIFSVNLWQSIH